MVNKFIEIITGEIKEKKRFLKVLKAYRKGKPVYIEGHPVPAKSDIAFSYPTHSYSLKPPKPIRTII